VNYVFDSTARDTYAIFTMMPPIALTNNVPRPNHRFLDFLTVMRCLVLLLALIFITLPAYAQSRGITMTGTVTCTGSPLPNVAIQISGSGSGSATTNSAGMYGFGGVASGTYMITPSKVGYTFSPATRTVTIRSTNVGNLDFIATLGQSSPQLPVATTRTATVLVMDVSGSMGSSWQGERKIESAKKAALQYIEQVANEPRSPGTIHEIAVVTFSGSATLVLQLTSSYSQARNAVIQLGTISSTNIGAGLTTALAELNKVPTAERFIILLSDGQSNTGLSDSQILSGPVAEARSKGICIHTVGFGSSGGINEAFLKDVASRSGCGTYNYASSGFGLFGTYIKVRHSTLGGEQIVDFTSQNQSVITLPNSPITIGAFHLKGQVRELHYTFAWSDVGRMSAKLVDPSGRTVTSAYPGATFYYGSQFAHVTVLSPPAGLWRVSAVPLQRFPASVQYYGVVSSRPGGVFPFHLPLFCIGDWCIPYPDLPTSLIVLISVAALAYVIYEQLRAL
jgi:Mg-chelatase subunit ChlD